MNAKKKFKLSTTHLILLSFLITILLGSCMLVLPISSATGKSVPYIDALFTATTSTCITGLVTVPTFSTWSLFGKIVILIMIQIGGLGVITIMTGFMLLLHRKMGMTDKLLVQDSFSLNSMSSIGKFVKKMLLGTLVIEGVGALLYMIVFVPEFGAVGIWYSVFNSISAFCNAGIDIIGANSLCNYAGNVLVNFTTCSLIVLSGLGFIVWWDIIRVIKNRKNSKKGILKDLMLHSKIVIVATLILIFGGALLFFIFEYKNPLTIANMSLFDKIQASFFQSITTRTAGFFTIPQEHLSRASSILSLVLMFIGASPAGTAGGLKTVTIVVLLCSAFATIRNKRQATIFNRTISEDSIRKAVALTVTFTIIMFIVTYCYYIYLHIIITYLLLLLRV